MKNIITNGALYLLFCVFFLFLVAFFFVAGLPSLRGEIPLQMYADSVTYEAIAKGEKRVNALISVNSNLFGPVFLFNMLGQSHINAFFFNVLTASVSLYFLLRYDGHYRLRLFVLLITSTLFVFSNFGVSKEAILFPLSVCLYNYSRGQSGIYLIIAILLSFLVRWQMVILCLFFWASLHMPYFKNHRYLYVVCVLLGMSVVIGIQSDSALAHVNDVARQGAIAEQGTEASGTFSALIRLQNSYGYFLAFLPKFMSLMFGLTFRLNFSIMTEDFWNYFVIMFQAYQNLFLLGFAFLTGRLRMADDTVFLIVIYSMIFAVTPIFGPRYFYPVTLWLIFLICRKRPAPRRKKPGWVGE